MVNLTGGTVERHHVRDFKGNKLIKLFGLISVTLSAGKMVGCCCSIPGRVRIMQSNFYCLLYEIRFHIDFLVTWDYRGTCLFHYKSSENQI